MDSIRFVILLTSLQCSFSNRPTQDQASSIDFDPDDPNDLNLLTNHPNTRYLKDFLPTNDKWRGENYEWLRQMPIGTQPETMQDNWREASQYVTLFDNTRNIPVFSVYQAEPYKYVDPRPFGNSGHIARRGEKVIENDRGQRPSTWEGDDTPGNGPTNADYEEAAAYKIDKGHLFPVQFASTPLQARATMKLTNAVPQDSIFNQRQWVLAETILKKTCVHDCQDSGFMPIVFTGAVPSYNKGDGAGFSWKGRITVPTHMWTAMLCYNVGHDTIEFFVSYIGMNLMIGEVRWYIEPDRFQQILKNMYNIETGFFFPNLINDKLGNITPTRSESVRKRIIEKYKEQEEKGAWEYARGLMVLPQDGDRNHWGDEDMAVQNVINDQMEIMSQLSSVSESTTFEVSDVEMEERRKKRDTLQNTTATATEIKYYPIKLVDSSTVSNISLSQCTIKETYAGGEEEHVISFEKNKLIVDPNTANGSKIDANITRNGVEVELEEKVSSMTRLSITLVPRHPAPQEEEEAGGGG